MVPLKLIKGNEILICAFEAQQSKPPKCALKIGERRKEKNHKSSREKERERERERHSYFDGDFIYQCNSEWR
jgi:hypothetical protein